MIFWFLPKTILSIGKVYLFGSYLNSLFSLFLHFKSFILNLCLFILSFILLITVNVDWVRWLSIFVMTYFYLIYIYRFLKKAFNEPTLFGTSIESRIQKFAENKSPGDSLVVKSFIIQKDDEKLQQIERRDVQLRRSVIATFVIELLTERLNGYRGKQAYIVSWIFGAFVFLLYSIIFFWFLNFQLFKIDASNFSYKGTFPSFDFLYYTLKTITYSDIDLVKPISVIARIIETSSFFTIGIFALIIVVSIFLSMKQDKVKENVKLTTDMFNSENSSLSKYMQDEFGMELKTAIGEIKNIDTSLKNLKNFIDKMF